jgi:hypothetical protein
MKILHDLDLSPVTFSGLAESALNNNISGIAIDDSALWRGPISDRPIQDISWRWQNPRTIGVGII